MPIPIWVSRYLPIPYREGGRSHDGIDCWGLARLVLQEQAGVDLPLYGGSRHQISTRAKQHAFGLGFIPIELVDAQLFDILSMLDPASGCREDLHCGVVIDDGAFIHAKARGGVTIGRFSLEQRNYVTGAWRFSGQR